MNKIKHFLFSLLGVALLCMEFSSCDNFLRGTNVKNDLDEALEIANSSPLSYFVTADENSGTVTPAQLKLKKKETFDIIFKPSDLYIFVKWEVLDKITGEPVEGVIKFTDETALETKGVVLNPRENIVIHPKCLLQPAILSHSPAGNDPQFANTPIIVYFNMPMEDTTVTSDSSLFNYDNILITATDYSTELSDMDQCFELPVFDSEKKILTIYPKPIALIEKIGNRPVIKLNISFTSSILVNDNDFVRSLRQDANSSFTVLYKPEKEEVAPIKIDDNFFVTIDNISLNKEQELLTCKKFHQETFDDVMTESGYDNHKIYDINEDDSFVKKVLQNRASDYIYIYGKFYDAGSGIKKVRVNQYEDATYFGDCKSTDYYVNSINPDDVEFLDYGNGYVEFCIKHKLLMVNDIYNFKVFIYDACDNYVEESFFAASRSSYDKYFYNKYNPDPLHMVYDGDMFFQMGNQPLEMFDDSYYSNTTVEAFLEVLNSNSKNIKIYYEHFNLHLFDHIFIHDNNIKIFCDYTDKDGKRIIKKEFENLTATQGYWSLDLDVDLFIDAACTITIEDQFGVQGKIIQNTHKERLIPDDRGLAFTPNKDLYDGLLILKKIDEDEFIFSQSYNSGQGHIRYSDEYEPVGYIYWDSFFFSDYMKINRPAETIEVVGEPVIRKDKNNHVCIDFTFADDTWEKFDTIACNVKIEERTEPIGNFTFEKDEILYNSGVYSDTDHFSLVLNKDKPGITYIRDSNLWDGTFLFSKKIYFLFAGGSSSYIPGESDGKINTIEIQPLVETEYDDQKPNIGIEQTIQFVDNTQGINTAINRLFNLKLEDNENGSGPKEAVIKYGNQEIILNEENNWTKSFTLQEIKKYLNDCSFDFEFVALDNSNNRIEGEGNILWEKPTEQNLPLKHVNSKYLKIETSSYYAHAYAYSYVDVFLPYGNGKWKHVFSGTDTYNIQLPSESTDSFTNTWVKVCAINKDKMSNPLYLYKYTGNESTSEHDFMTKNATSKKSVVISSDQPVFVHTFITNETYEKCNSWSAERWYQFEDELDGKVMNFNPENPIPLNYTINSYYSINDGQCYVIIAHFANGEVLMSEVMQK